MSKLTNDTGPQITIQSEPDGRSDRVDLMLGEKSISRLWLTHFTLQIGEARVRMEGVGGVGTEESYRSRGHSRRVIEAAVEHMGAGDAALSMLYGIRDFYPKFGYATAGPDYLIVLTELEKDCDVSEGWSVRPLAADDISAVRRLYERYVGLAAGAAMREESGSTWSRLEKCAEGVKDDACRVVVGPDRCVHGYLWRAQWCWYVRYTLQEEFKRALIVSEVIADGPRAADAVLAAARLWAREEPASHRIREVALAAPHEGAIAAAAMRQDARFVANHTACGGSMARVINVARLLEALRPELANRLQASGSRFTGSLAIHTDIGSATLQVSKGRLTIASGEGADPEATVYMPQYELARLALGAFPPEEILSRLTEQPSGQAADLIRALFPARTPHMYLPDRY